MADMNWETRLIGVHCSTTGGLAKGVERGNTLGCTAIQIFSKNNSRWTASPLTDAEYHAFVVAKQHSSVKMVFAHAGYLINLASGDPSMTERSMESMRQELERAHILSLPYIVLHPGAHKGDGEIVGIRRIADRLNILIEETSDSPVRILLEGTAGQGTCIGHRFEHLRDILARIHDDRRVGVCLDTAHLFAAGYDLRTPKTYEATWKEFEEIVGRRWLYAMHLNDSKVDFGKRVDRHDHLGKGKIGVPAFRMLMKDARLREVPFVCETPKGVTDAEDLKNLAVLYKYHNRAPSLRAQRSNLLK